MLLPKLAGIRKAVVAAMNENVSRNRSAGELLTCTNFAPEQVKHYFEQAAAHVETLKTMLPDLYGKFEAVETKPATEMAASKPNAQAHWHNSMHYTTARNEHQTPNERFHATGYAGA